MEENLPPKEVFYLSRDSNYHVYKYDFIEINEKDSEFVYLSAESNCYIYINKGFGFGESTHTFNSLEEAIKYRDYEIENKIKKLSEEIGFLKEKEEHASLMLGYYNNLQQRFKKENKDD